MTESTTYPEQRPAEAAALPAAVETLADDPMLRQAIELLFFAYRDFTGDADALLAR